MDGAPSRLEAIEAAAIRRWQDVFIGALREAGVSETAAVATCERDVTLRVWGDRVYAECGELRSTGSSEAHVAYFARLFHLHHRAELGGKPVPLGNTPAPVPEGVQRQAARVAAAKQEFAEYSAQQQAAREAHAAELGEQDAAFLMERAPRPDLAF